MLFDIIFELRHGVTSFGETESLYVLLFDIIGDTCMP